MPDRTTLFCIHFLGGSAKGWQRVTDALGAECVCVPVDLPGFGAAADVAGYSVSDMADYVATAIRKDAPERWLIVGHSMGAKIAAVLARRAEDGEPGLQGLAGLVLLAGSPPGPEPMDEDQRQAMMGWFAGDERSRRADAQGYVDANVGAPLDKGLNQLVVANVLRANRDAWVAWLDRGSREDWSDRVGVLRTPALIVTGSEDENLGEDAQRRLTAPHFATTHMVCLPGAGHLLPMERPEEIARLIETQVTPAPPIAATYRALIESDRVSTGTRAALMARAIPDDPGYLPVALWPTQFATLRAVLARVLPQPGPGRIDLAARLDASLAAGKGDGWRFAALPPDADSWRAGLDTLDAQVEGGFTAASPTRQDALLARVAEAGATDGALTADQMRMWFEDLRADAVRVYMAHPATLSRMGYSGIGYGGDGEPKPGFTQIGAGEREAWEPVAQ